MLFRPVERCELSNPDHLTLLYGADGAVRALPIGLVRSIFAHLELQDVFAAAQVCRNWNVVVLRVVKARALTLMRTFLSKIASQVDQPRDAVRLRELCYPIPATSPMGIWGLHHTLFDMRADVVRVLKRVDMATLVRLHQIRRLPKPLGWSHIFEITAFHRISKLSVGVISWRMFSRLLALGEWALAVSATQWVFDRSERDELLMKIAEQSIAEGESKRALRVIHCLSDPHLRNFSLSRLCLRSVRAGDLNQAALLTSELDEDELRGSVLQAIALKALEMGDLNQAVDAAAHIPREGLRDVVMGRIAEKVACLGRWAEAEAVAAYICDADHRADLFKVLTALRSS